MNHCKRIGKDTIYSLYYISRRKMKMTVGMRTVRRLRTQKEIKDCKAVAEEDN